MNDSYKTDDGYNFDCPYCGQSLSAQEELFGLSLDCPVCAKSIQVPYMTPKQPADSVVFSGRKGKPFVNVRIKKKTVNWDDDDPNSAGPPPGSRKCPFCQEYINGDAIKCKHCGEELDMRSQEALQRRKRRPGIPSCPHCKGRMRKTSISSNNCLGAVAALIIIGIGILFFFIIPVVGWVIGPLIAIGGLFVGGSTKKVWKCVSCGSIIDRA